MAYNPFFPVANPYQAMMQQMPQVQQTQQQGGGLIWVQGIEAAKSYPVLANQSILLMDSESDSFFIKSADASGMPLPLRIFDYKERNHANKQNDKTEEPQIDVSGFITRDEFETRMSQIMSEFERKDNRNQNQQRGGGNNGK